MKTIKFTISYPFTDQTIEMEMKFKDSRSDRALKEWIEHTVKTSVEIEFLDQS